MYLKRLEIQGFKTFATRTAFEFRPGITAVVGPNGSGKCLRGDALVTLADGREIPIRDLVDRALSGSQTVEVLDDGWITRENPDRIAILSLNPETMRLEPRPVFGFVKREAPEDLLCVRTRSGRTVTATPYHPLFTLEAGALRTLRADEIRPGIRIAVPRDIQTTSDVYWDEVVDLERITPDDPWVYDLSIAETHNFVADNIIVHNSNIADAVRWVLGEQSLSNLRCKRTEELLYAGGGRRSPAGLAEVALTIDNSDRLLPLDFDEVTVTRRATRAGDNEYFINRARVRLRDLVEAVEPLGGSYTIINQGLVDAALTLRPEERRRLFEDAAEIGGFELRKAEALRRLRETEGNLQRIDDLLAELEPRLRSLKRQAGQARQHNELTDELHTLQVQFYVAQWRAATALCAATAAEVARTERELDQARAAQATLSAEVHALRAELRARRDALGGLHEHSAELHRQAESLQRDLAVGAERMAALTRRGEDLERRRQELALRREEAHTLAVAAAAEAERADAELSQRRAELHRAEAELADGETARRELAQLLRQAQDAAVRAASAVAQAASRIEQAVRQQERFVNDQTELDAAVAQAKQRLAAANLQVEQARAELARSEQARSAAAEAERAARAELEQLRSERAQADEARSAVRRTLADAEARYDSLARLARSYAGAFAGVRAAMQWAERAGRSGFALIQSIIRTPAEIETAIETALGSRLQNIVVERWEDAEDAIADLKRSSAGRATFLPLDSIRRTENQQPGIAATAPHDRSRFSVLGSASVFGIAADLVEYDPQYEPVVRQLLGRVLVVRDLPTARAELRKLSGGWTIVTLSGEQVNSGGAVTGGAQAKESGALRRERELRELPEQIEQRRAELERIEQRRGDLEQQNQRLTHHQRELEQRTREAQRTYDTARTGVETATRRVEQGGQEHTWAMQRRERLSADLAAIDAQITAIRAEIAEAEQAQAQADQQLAALQARQDAQNVADRAAQDHLAGVRASVGAAEGQLRAQRALLAAQEQAQAQLTAQDEALAREALALGGERERYVAQHEQAETNHQALLVAIDDMRSRIDPAEAALHVDETRQAELEEREAAATANLLAAEATHGRAALEAQRAADRQEALFERAAADGIDVAGPFIPQPPLTQAEEGESVPPAELRAAELQSAIDSLKTRILRLGVVNPLALEEYAEAAERQQFLSGQVADLRQASETLQELIAELDEAMQSRFQATFKAVAAEFEQTFTQLFGGGSARLQLTNIAERNGQLPEGEAAPAARSAPGVEIIVRPPGKKQQNISLLSGGERSLTASALLFAILRVNPSPFCILDETDAALDESNVGRFRDALHNLTHRTQFILITHNRGTIEAADTLYGVTMGEDGGSKVMSLRVEEYVNAEE
jgi:chromosome segregation protein